MKKNPIFVSFACMAAMLLLTLSSVSCKEEEQDDPNIIYRSFTKTVTSTLDREIRKDSIDINADGITDFLMLTVSTAAADTVITYAVGNNTYWYVDSTQTYFVTNKVKNMFSGEQPELKSSKSEWYNFVFTGAKTGPQLRGYAGVGDVFIPILLIVSPNIHYGWVRINVSSDYRTFKVLDAAYHLTPDTPIKMGAK